MERNIDSFPKCTSYSASVTAIVIYGMEVKFEYTHVSYLLIKNPKCNILYPVLCVKILCPD